MNPRLAAAILLLALSACERTTPPDEQATAGLSRADAEAVYLKHCAICHGEKGDGYGPRRGSLFRKPPDFRQPDWRAGRSAAEIRAVIRNGRPGTDMPAWKNLDDDALSGVTAHVLAFAKAAPGTGAGD